VLAIDSLRSTDKAKLTNWLRPLASAATWLGLVALVTVGLVASRGVLSEAHAALVYLVVVLAGSALCGRRLGFALAVLCFLAFNFFLLRPYYTFVVADPLDWLVLVAFLITSLVVAHLLDRAQQQAATARRHAREIDRLSTLGAETLNAPRAEGAVEAVTRVIQSMLRIGACEIYHFDPAMPDRGHHLIASARRPGFDPAVDLPSGALLTHVAEHATAAWQRADGTTQTFLMGGQTLDQSALGQPDAHSVILPLRVRDRMVGILSLADDQAIVLDEAQRRFMRALAYYAALGVERMNLEAEAERVESLREADRLKDALLASLSHDLRTPLTAIKALAEEIRGSGDERAAMIELEADRLNRLVADLLDLSRLDAGGLRVQPELNAADDLLGAALDSLVGAPRASEIDARMESDEPIVGRFDFVHSLRALVNLIENALKYSPAGSRVEVVAARQDDRVEFRVMDRGPGVPASERERIFEPFFRAAGSEPDVGGAGLGLSIARRLVEAQQGGVHYEPRPGGGSVFLLWVPAVEITELELISS
jgi:two-component system sensor histidine kinase KdpD